MLEEVNFFLSNRGFYVPSPIFESGAGFVGIIFILALIVSYLFKRWANKIQNETGKIYPVFWFSTGIIIGATTIAYFLKGMPLSWEIPVLKGFILRAVWQLNLNSLHYG